LESFLIIVDDEDSRAICVEAISKNFECQRIDHISSEAEALKQLRMIDYSAIIADLDIMDIGGVGFYEKLKEDFPFASERVGFISEKPIAKLRGLCESRFSADGNLPARALLAGRPRAHSPP